MNFRKKPVVVEAVQWFRLGDHPVVVPVPANHSLHDALNGSIVAHYGWCPTLEGGHIVTPGDWIIKGVKGEFYPCKPDVFAKTYESVEEGGGR